MSAGLIEAVANSNNRRQSGSVGWEAVTTLKCMTTGVTKSAFPPPKIIQVEKFPEYRRVC